MAIRLIGKSMTNSVVDGEDEGVEVGRAYRGFERENKETSMIRFERRGSAMANNFPGHEILDGHLAAVR
jgi:hypothetical protein